MINTMIQPKWDCYPYTQAKIDALLNQDKEAIAKLSPHEQGQIEQINKDLPRNEWLFGPRTQNQSTGGLVFERPASSFRHAHELRIYSWIVPEWKHADSDNNAKYSLETVLQDKNSFLKLKLRARELQKVLKQVGKGSQDQDSELEKRLERLDRHVNHLESLESHADLSAILEASVLWIKSVEEIVHGSEAKTDYFSGPLGKINLIEERAQLQKLKENVKLLETKLTDQGLISQKPENLERAIDRYLETSFREIESKDFGLEDFQEKSDNGVDAADAIQNEVLEPLIVWMENAKKLAGNVKPHDERALELSLEESQALFVFSDTVGDSFVLQGGCVRGVVENCFRQGWIFRQDLFVFQHNGEDMRLNRLANGKLSVSAYFETRYLGDALDRKADYTDENDLLPKNKENKQAVIIKISSEQLMEKKVDAQERAVFVMTPQEQEVHIDDQLWIHLLLPRAFQRLQDLAKENVVWKPYDLFALIPYLLDTSIRKDFDKKTFRGEFCKALAKQPEFVQDFAKTWISACFNTHPNISLSISKELQNEIDIVSKANQKKEKAIAKARKSSKDLPEEKDTPPKIIRASVRFEGYEGYAGNPKFQQAFAEEITHLPRRDYDQVLETIQNRKRDYGPQYARFRGSIPDYPISIHIPKESFNTASLLLGLREENTQTPADSAADETDASVSSGPDFSFSGEPDFSISSDSDASASVESASSSASAETKKTEKSVSSLVSAVGSRSTSQAEKLDKTEKDKLEKPPRKSSTSK